MGVNIKKLDTNKWLLDIRIVRNHREIHRVRKTFFGTKPQAEDRYFEIKKSLKEGKLYLPLKKNQYFKDLLFQYRDKRGGIPKKEDFRFKTLLNDLGNIPLKLFPDKFEEYLKILKRLPSPSTGKIRSDATINRYVNMVKACFNLGVSLGLIEKNPITKYRFPKKKECPRDKILNKTEIDRFFTTIKKVSPQIFPIVNYALQIPCRRSELLNMRRGDLDLINNCIRVKNGTTKNNQGIWKPIPPDMVQYFRTLPNDCDYLFYKELKGKFLPLGEFKHAWYKCLQLAGIEDFRFHDLRHISATNLIDNGTPERVVMAIAGWKSQMLTIYYHRSGKDLLKLARFSEVSNKVDPPVRVAIQEG